MVSVLRRRQVDVLGESLLKNIILFSIPLILSNLLQTLYNVADMMVVGLAGAQGAVGSIGITSSVIDIIINLCVGFGAGVSVVVARSVGAKDDAKVSRAVHTVIPMAAVFGLFACIVGQLTCRRVLKLMGAEGEVLKLATLYCRINFIGAPFVALTNFTAGIFRAKGDSETPLRVLGLSGLLNVLMNLFLVLVCGMSVAGVAIATKLSNVFSAVVLILKLRHDDGPCRFSFRKMKFHTQELKEVLTIGLPAAVQYLTMSLGTMFLQSAVVTVNNAAGGSYVLDGNAAGTSIGQIIGTVTTANAAAAMTFVGQHYGAGRLKRIYKVVASCWLVSILACAAVCAVVLPLDKILTGLYVKNDPAAMDVALLKLYIVGPLYWLLAVATINSNAIRAIGHSSTATALYVLGICGIRIGWAVLIFPQFGTLPSIYLSYPTSWIVTSVVTGIVGFALLNRKIKNAATA